MSDIQIFSDSGWEVRIVERDGDPWFVARDVCLALGYIKPENAIPQHCKGTLKQGIPTAGGMQEVLIIPERDLYRLIMRSKLPSAEKFEEWVCGEVLPAIRKNGRYEITEEKPDRSEQLDLGYIALGHLKKQLALSDVSYLWCATKLHEDLGISTAMLPAYVEKVRVTFSATDLLKKNECRIGVRAFNKLLLEQGFLEVKTRMSTKGKAKDFKALTEIGLKYGTNDSSPNNPRETQPHYYEDTFMDLFEIVAGV